MKFKHIIYSIFSIVCTLTVLTGCSDEVVVPDESTKPGNNGDGDYTLDVVVTLDNMGGRSTSPSDLTEIENYIDVEKLRVLFFTCVDKDPNVAGDYNHDYFLFETKNHFVKKIDTTNGDNRWLITIPMYTHGNNADSFNWDWDFIRDCLTSRPFKIAILANRPDYDYVDEFSGNDGGALIPAGYMDNRGPYWGTADAYDGVASNKSKWKDVFDLQHCQFDINYVNKSTSKGFYDFIMGDWGYEDGRSWSSAYSSSGLGANNVQPKMGATVSWLDWEYKVRDDNGNVITDTYSNSSGIHITEQANEKGFKNTSGAFAKRFRLPSYDYPIPMYGIQVFDAIEPEKWIKGTPFYLSSGIPGDYNADGYTKKSISLLRSAVKMELYIPKSAGELQMVSMCYSNVYSRCDPMDTWTPTNELWAKGHNADGTSNGNCEIESILKYGSLCSGNSDDRTESKSEYQELLSWFYGIWKEKGWTFNGYSGTFADGSGDTPYPQIFNSAIQRNQLVICDSNTLVEEDDMFYHYIIYCGERNVMDPSSLGVMHRNGAGSSMLQYWLIQISNQVYGIPITNYGNTSNPVHDVVPIPNNQGKNVYTTRDGLTYMANHQNPNSNDAPKTINDHYQQEVMRSPKDVDIIPWPLIRNHVYTVTLSSKSENNGSASGRGANKGPVQFTVKCEDNHSEHI